MAYVDAFGDGVAEGAATRRAIDAEVAWTYHQVIKHRLNPPCVDGCPKCAEWGRHLALDPEEFPDLDNPVEFEVALHAVRHQVRDPLMRRYKGSGEYRNRLLR
jgi:hypothetical protein